MIGQRYNIVFEIENGDTGHRQRRSIEVELLEDYSLSELMDAIKTSIPANTYLDKARGDKLYLCSINRCFKQRIKI